MSLYVLKTKNRKQKYNIRLYDMNWKKCKSSSQAQKNKQSKSKFIVSFRENL